MDRVKVEPPDVVRHVIASEWLRAEVVSPALGSVTLRPHQLDATARLRDLLADRGGALLCDHVGLGKTYVALALARSCARPLVVAPASLRDMWLAAARRAQVAVGFASAESLSRSPQAGHDHDLVIVDEAHHFRTPSTARYRSLAKLAARSPILLVTATPVHNRKADITALLALFLGSAARTLSAGEIARLVVRRDQSQATSAYPTVRAPAHLRVPHDERHLELLLALPPPTPASDGGIAAAMVAYTLVRLWASSDSALREGLRRRLAKTVAIRASLETGRYPTRRDLEAWSYGDGTVQLGFAQILAPENLRGRDGLLNAVREHERALARHLASLPGESPADAARVEHIRALRRVHPDARIVAFSQFAETVAMVYRRLARDKGVAMLTSRGACIASGPIARREALTMFAPTAHGVARPSQIGDISLLIATDLLSEGVNLQDASVVVHLDLPWTATTLEQRVGRVARLGSRNSEVLVYVVDPPASGAHFLRAETIIRRKAALADASVGASRIPPLFAPNGPGPGSRVEDAEAIRYMLSAWAALELAVDSSRPVCAAVTAKLEGMLALVTVRGRPVLLADSRGTLSADGLAVREVIESAGGEPAAISARDLEPALDRVRGWIDCALASEDAGKSSIAGTMVARRLTARLAQHLSVCPLHERTHFSARAAAVHRRIQSPLTLGIEREVEDLLDADLSAQEFMSRLGLIMVPSIAATEDSASGIRGLLILRVPNPL